MTTEATAGTAGRPCWVSLLVHGLEPARDFYRALFGWEFTEGPGQFGPYVRATLGGREVAGLGELPAGRRLPVSWTPYFASQDADVTAQAVRSGGGTVAVGPLDAEDQGRMMIAADPQGAVFGVWQGTAMTGAAVTGEPGSVAWHELVTWRTGASRPFYTHVFPFDTGTVGPEGAGAGGGAAAEGGFDYLTLHLAGRPVAGLFGAGERLPRGEVPYWSTYFAVADTDVAVRRVTELGGRVLQAPQDSPFGRLATVADPEGAAFTVIEA
ncbi:VOC family protein [Streptomyces sp. NPDC059740]|uniref:VOC family protein n=1 Tax=Streptomyces sp. NPDC059740 TaxID=3346926 RepID=UPI0036591BB8